MEISVKNIPPDDFSARGPEGLSGGAFRPPLSRRLPAPLEGAFPRPSARRPRGSAGKRGRPTGARKKNGRGGPPERKRGPEAPPEKKGGLLGPPEKNRGA
jgi:hypothetical protein